ncbi:MAG TPA: ATP-binding protein [Nocardioidaceae bacterium]|nr:ATP-binding protein [Nocardioidaceae bacterium]
MRLDFHGASVRAARERLRRSLANQCPESRIDDARVVLSELVANSLRHAKPLDDHTIAVGWTMRPDVLRLSVTDGGSPTSVPAPRRPGELATGGRGLKMVQTLAERWGVESAGVGTTVWAEVALH